MMMMLNSPLLRLPGDALSLLPPYLVSVEKENERVFVFSRDWRNFMNTNKEHFGEWKAQSRVISLSVKYSMLFFRTISFRNVVLNAVFNPSLQISVNLKLEQRTNVDLSHLPPLKRIEMHGPRVPSITFHPEISCSDVRFTGDQLETYETFRNVRKLFVSSMGDPNIDLSNFLNLEELELFGMNLINCCPLPHLQKASFEACDGLDGDLSWLSRLSSLRFAYVPEVLDIGSLKDVSILKFEQCDGISDVSCLRNARELTFDGCENITDVSQLGSVHTLLMNFCNVQDVSALGSVYRLSVRTFEGNDISSLLNVVILDLSESEITDISSLGNSSVTDLNISNCSKISDISMLTNVVKLNISCCPKIYSLSGLTSLKELILYPASSGPVTVRSGWEVFAQLRSLTLGCIGDKFLNLMFGELAKAPLKELRLEKCKVNLEVSNYLSRLKCLQILELDRCHGKMIIPEIQSLGKLLIYECRVPKLFIEGRHCQFPVYHVEVIKCKELEEVNVTRPISFMKFHDYYQVEIDGKENVKELQYTISKIEQRWKANRK
jgi:hypothetical protein